MSFTQDFKQAMDGAADVVDGLERSPIVLDPALGDFENGCDLSSPTGDSPSVSGTAGEGTSFTLDLTLSLEFIHFGHVFRDRATWFAHEHLNDLDPNALTRTPGGRALVYRAALQREIALAHSMVVSLQRNLKALSGGTQIPGTQAHVNETMELPALGALGDLVGYAGDVIGGAGAGAAQAAAIDLNPFFEELKRIATSLNDMTIRYPVIHQAGIDLQAWRANFYRYVGDEYVKLLGLVEGPSPPGLLDQLGALTPLGPFIPDGVKTVFSYVPKVMRKAFEVHLEMLLALQLALGRGIEAACRDMSVRAIRSRQAPVLPVWFAAAPASAGPSGFFGDPGLPSGDDVPLVGGALNAVKQGYNTVDQKAGAVADFLSRPYQRVPGGPLLESMFLFQQPGQLRAGESAVDLGRVATEALRRALRITAFPKVVEDVLTHLAAINADFVRAIYGQLLTWNVREPLPKEAMLRAGQLHLLNSIMDTLKQHIPILARLSNLTTGFMFGGRWIGLNPDVLVARLLELVEESLRPQFAAVIDKAMKDMWEQLELANRRAVGTPTFETFLGALPGVLASGFFYTFFPLFDVLLNQLQVAVFDQLAPVVADIGGDDVDKNLLDQARNRVDGLRNFAAKVDAVRQVIDQGLAPKLGNLDGGLFDALGADATKLPDLPDESLFGGPLVLHRTGTGRADSISLADFAQVTPDLKWEEPDEDDWDEDDEDDEDNEDAADAADADADAADEPGAGADEEVNDDSDLIEPEGDDDNEGATS